MGDVQARAIRQELMSYGTDQDVRSNLGDLRRINRWLGGHRIVASLLRKWYRPDEPFALVDIGAASGDMGAHVGREFPHATVVSLDAAWRNLLDCPGLKLVGDAFQLPLRTASVDVAMCSLFLHHFTDEDATRALREMARVARRGVIAVDLERHWLARGFLPATRWLFRWHPLTVYDGTLSVEAAFRRSELRRLGDAAGLRACRVRAHLPWFRLSLVGRP